MAPKKNPDAEAAVPEEAGAAVDVTVPDLRAILLAFQAGLNELTEMKEEIKEIRRMSDPREGAATGRTFPSPLRRDTFGSVADMNA